MSNFALEKIGYCVEITAYLDYERVEKIKGLLPLSWERAAEDED